jgi:hypothetical protein
LSIDVVICLVEVSSKQLYAPAWTMLAVLHLFTLILGLLDGVRSHNTTESLAFLSPSAAGCKATTRSTDWPSEKDWAELNRLVGGKLLKPFPAAAPCHRDSQAYNPARCEVVRQDWKSSEFHANHPTSTLWTNVNGYSCGPESTGGCTGSGFPVYVLNATTAQQIGAAVKWASQKNVRVNVKSTGHDFLGR